MVCKVCSHVSYGVIIFIYVWVVVRCLNYDGIVLVGKGLFNTMNAIYYLIGYEPLLNRLNIVPA